MGTAELGSLGEEPSDPRWRHQGALSENPCFYPLFLEGLFAADTEQTVPTWECGKVSPGHKHRWQKPSLGSKEAQDVL